MKNKTKVIAGLLGAVRQAERMVEANKKDIRNGHPFEKYLEQNEKRLRRLETKLRNIRNDQV